MKPIDSQVLGPLQLAYDISTNEIFYVSSTRKLKKNIEDLTENTTDLYSLRPTEYDSLDGKDHVVGLVAEEAAESNKYFAAYDGNAEPMAINWNAVTLFMIAEMKKLRQELDELKAHIA